MRRMLQRMKNEIRKQDGYFTVEATLMFTSIVFIILAILYSFMLMYQYTVVLNAASDAARTGVNVWAAGGSEDEIRSAASSAADASL